MRFLHVLRYACVCALLAVTAFATVPSSTNWLQYTLTTNPQTLPVTFVFQNGSDLVVYDTRAGANPVTLTQNSDYSVTGGNGSTGNVVTIAGGSHGVLTGDVITISRNVPLTQTTTFSNSGPLTPSMIGAALDKLTQQVQQLNTKVLNSVRFEPDETIDGTLSREARKSKVYGWDANGNPEYVTQSSGGGGSTYFAGTGLALNSNTFSVLPTQSFTDLTVTNPIAGSVTGNAGSASVLATPRNINGIAFDGSADITVPAAAATLTGTTLASNVVNSSLTSYASGAFGNLSLQNSNALTATGGTLTGVAVTGLSNPSVNSDAANKAYVDSVASGVVPRTSVVVGTTANITLSAPQTIDGVAVIAGQRVLVKNQTAPAENGIYDVAAGAWSRSSDSNTAGKLLRGYTYFITSGSTQASQTWSITTAPTVLESDPVVFTQTGSANSYNAGTGLNLAGNTFSIASTQSGLAISSSTLNSTVIGGSSPAAATFTQATVSGNTFVGNLVLKSNQLNESATNATAEVGINYDGYSGGTTQFRNLTIYDGKNNQVAQFVGSSKALNLGGTFTATTADTANTIIAKGATGQLVNIGYYDATFGSITNALNTAGNATIPYSINSSNTRFLNASNLIVSINSNGLSIATNALLRATKSNLHLKVVNVMDYGAVGDGSTDDTAAINTAVAALTSYSTLYFPAPANYYKITSGITALDSISYVTVCGDGQSSRIHNSTTGAAGNTFVVNSTCTHVDFKNLAITGAATVRGSGIHIRLYSSYSSVTNCYIQGCSDFAVHVSNDSSSYNTGTKIQNCVFDSPLGDGVHVANAVEFDVSNNIFINTGDDSIGIVADDTAHVPTRGNVTGNVIYNAGGLGSSVSGCGIRVAEANDVIVANNQVTLTYESGIRLTRYLSTTNFNNRCKVIGNKLYSVAGHLGANAIDAYHSSDCEIEDNKVNSPSFGVGVMMLNVDNLKIASNVFKGVPSGGVRTDNATTNVQSTWDGIYIKDNIFGSVTANEAMYVVPGAGITVTNLFIDNNVGKTLPGGNWIYYDQVTGGRIVNNTRTGTQTIGAGGTVSSVTSINNN